MKLVGKKTRTFGMGTNPEGGQSITVLCSPEEMLAIMASGWMFYTHCCYENSEGGYSYDGVNIPRTLTRNIEGLPMGGGINPVYTAAVQVLGYDPIEA